MRGGRERHLSHTISSLNRRLLPHFQRAVRLPFLVFILASMGKPAWACDGGGRVINNDLYRHAAHILRATTANAILRLSPTIHPFPTALRQQPVALPALADSPATNALHSTRRRVTYRRDIY